MTFGYNFDITNTLKFGEPTDVIISLQGDSMKDKNWLDGTLYQTYYLLLLLVNIGGTIQFLKRLTKQHWDHPIIKGANVKSGSVRFLEFI